MSELGPQTPTRLRTWLMLLKTYARKSLSEDEIA